MIQNKNYLIRGRAYVHMFLLLCMLFAVQGVWADNFMQNPANYTAIPIGIDKVRFTLPTQFDSNTANEGILYGHVNYTIDDDTRLEPLLTWGLGDGYNDFSDKYESGKITLVPYKGGTWQLVGKTKGGYKYFNSDVTFTVGPNDDDSDHYSTVVEWTIPYELRGHKFTFRLFCRIDDRNTHWFIPDGVESVHTVSDTYKMGEFDCPAPPMVEVTLNDPMIAYSTDHPGTLMIPYNVQAAKVTKATLHYTDALTNESFTQELSTKLVDFAYLPIDRPWKDVYISVDVIDTANNTVKDIKSEKISTNMMHFPQKLKAVVQPFGSVLLTWTIDNAQLDDFDDGDYFEIQRNVNGSTDANDEGWTTIAMEQSLIKDKTEYSFIDNTLLDRYKNKPVAYRVRRTGAATWRWAPGSGVSMKMVPTVLALPGIHEAHVQRTTWNDELHKVQFDYVSGTKYDREGRFIVRNDADWDELQKLVNDGKLTYDKAVMTLLDEDDWVKFCDRTDNDNAASLNAVMLGDIDLGDIQKMAGDHYEYKGTFDGFGHTLTINYVGKKTDIAPFSFVQGATIKNLTVTGKITNEWQNSGGLVGLVSDSAVIDRCVVKVDIVSKFELSDYTLHGGLVAHMKDASKITITNSAFLGSFLGDKTAYNGGFIGETGSNCDVKMSNCLFAPVTLPFNMKDCATFVRKNSSTTLTLDNCYYTKLYSNYVIDGKAYYVINTSKDWESFAELVEQSPKGTELYAILAADITVTNMIGSEAKPFYGIFDGFGHTITANINTDLWAAAPFRVVGNATVKRLHVTGNVTGGRHASGLIGSRDGTPDIHVEKVWVSANVTTTDHYLAGIIGHVGGANAYISDTRFDGKLTAPADSYGAQNSYGGAIIGWGGEGGWTFHRVYDHSTRENVYWYFYCIDTLTGEPVSWGGNAASTLTVTHNAWTNVPYHDMSDEDQVVELMNNERAGAWHLVGDIAVPSLPTGGIYQQGISATQMSLAELKTALGDDQWYESDGMLQPVQETSEDHAYCINIWDNRAKFMLYKKMQGENGITTEIVDLSADENAIKNHTFTHDLTRKCVEYEFELVVKRGSSPMMIAGSAVDTLAKAVEKVEVDNPSYKFMNLNKVTGVAYEKKQSSVRLAWEVTGGESDFYRVLRRKHSTDKNAEWTDTIATNLQQQFYEDKKMLVQQAYDYRVESVLQCEGMHITSAELKGAECEPTGKISGYVRMADGTAMAGIGVTCTPSEGIIGGITQTTQTDEAGFFEFSGLPYQGTGTYYISIDGTGYKGPNEMGEVSFNQNTNWTQGFNYYMDNYYIYSGNVFYRDTSIPVPGVSFKLDGNVMHDANQNVIITDTQGAFSLSIPAGSHRVQAVKDGHNFANDGYLINKDAVAGREKDYNFNTNVAGVYLWDSTTVVLRGRVIGGDDQGKLPLGESMSVNNLGDSIKIVMQLEGDNASYLIRKQDDETVKTADYQYTYGLNNRDTTNVHVTRHMITIRPDNKTGEYQLALHPAKYKVIEISAQGYATLFQDGKVGETLDMTFNVQGDTCEYNRIYHSMPTVDVKQYNVGDEPYFGVKKVTAADVLGKKATINTWYWKKLENKDSIGVYSLGYPIFMSGSPYGWILQACEKYHYNNNPNNAPDIVKLKGGKVTIKNGMVSVTDSQELTFDDEGGASYIFTPKNTTPVMTGESALMNVSITLEYDNTFFDIKPMNGNIFQGYVMATVAKPEGRKSVSTSIPQLIDVLRDPPGATSSAYLEEGSKLSYSYNADLAGAAGLTFHLIKGSANNTYTGGVVVPPNGQGTTAGTYVNSQKKDALKIDAITYYNQGWTFSYNFDVTQRIQTQTGKKWVGARADVFIGMTTEVIVEDAIALRVVPDSMYQIYKTNEGGSFKVTDSEGNSATFKVPTGTAKVLVEGVDDTGQPVYLIRDEVMAVGPKLQSTFAHSQYYIENELIPDIIKLRNSLILPMGTDSLYAKQLADKRGYCTYISKVPENDISFGHTGYYDRYVPEGSLAGDSIMSLNTSIEAWLLMLAENERQKLTVQESNLVKRYDFDGAANIQYSETFSNVQSETRSLRYPGINDAGQVADGLLTAIKVFIEAAQKSLQAKGQGASNKPDAYYIKERDDYKSVSIAGGGAYMDLNFEPVLSLNFTDKSGTSKTSSKKIGFTLAASSKSSLTVDVYRTATELTLDKNTTFNNATLEMLDMLRYGKLGSNPTDYLETNETVYSNFVYRTRGGVTCGPYEKEYVSKWYLPGTVIDAATIPADKPKIWVDEPVISNVPFDEPARFTLHMANESDYPERASLVFNYFLLANSNPKGAKLFVEGAPINSQGVNITLYPCRDKKNEVTIFTKELELYPSQDFDYENLVLGLYDPEDANRVFNCTLSAHFVPTAGKVNISTPSSNWVVNTESPYDGKRQAWYLPVKIDGFDTNYRGFDHIELQYKLSTQGEKDWVSVCSYYADEELRAKASGVTDTIPANGTIIAPFYGEIDPIEQYYDLRAVNYCRHGNGFLTRSSEVLTGIKDTRLPVAFGTPEPTDGVLGIGDDIVIKFSEPIAGNYLRKINNFEMLGTKNSNDLTAFTSLTFSGQSYAMTQSNRNLAGKNFTVDVMLDPADDAVPMDVFAHGGMEKGLRFGLTADRKLSATINGKTVESDQAVPFNHVLRQVAYALDQSGDGMTVSFFDQNKLIGKQSLTGKYEGSSPMMVGYGHDVQNNYKGDMLEMRLWNRVMTNNELDTYGRKQLTGYETGLLNYYPLNEGEGEWGYDKAPSSMDLMLVGTSWKRPSGLSIALKGDKAMLLDPNQFYRRDIHDYTLMFWFRTNDDNTTLFSNGEALRGQDDKINIGIKDACLYVRSSGFEKNTETIVNEGSWHHFAMTVSRSQNVANVYVDKRLVDSFAADSLSGIKGDSIALGATFVDVTKQTNIMHGNIDEVAMFESVLPLNLIKEYSNHTPLGTTTPLMAYLSFEQSKNSDDNTQELVPSGVSLKRYVDTQNNIQARRDSLVSDETVKAFSDKEYYAPMLSTAKLENINYNFVSNDNQLFISVNEPDYMVEKTNVYVTVKDVPDLQGNLMASPITLNLFIYRNPLRWDVKRIEKEVNYGEGMTFEATVKNLSGVTQNYSLEDLPVWISASHTSGTIAALDEQVIKFTVSPYINIGTYNEQISLTGDNKMTEPLPITLSVRGSEPEWVVSDQLKQLNQTMMMVARVKIDGVVANSKEDILGVFDEYQQTLGVAHIEVNQNNNANEALAYLTIYGYTNPDGSKPKLNFRFFKANTGSIYKVEPKDGTVYTFTKNGLVGSATNPVVLEDDPWHAVWWINLKKGWNWVSIPITANDQTVGQFLDGLTKWEVGDKIMTVNGTTTEEYTCRENKKMPRGYKWDNENQPITIKPTQMYNIYSMSDKTIYLEGTHYYGSLTVHKDWNRISYTPIINLPISQAMADYTDQALEGDVVKSQDGFAIASQGGNGLIWKGTLQYMEAGKGYMLMRQADSNVEFLYPVYFSDNQYSGNGDAAMATRQVNTVTTMNIVATVEGVETETGDRLVVYSGAERMAEATSDAEQNYYLNIGSDANNGETLTFAIERNGETIAMTGSHISYAANKVIGSPDQPTAINFTALDQMPHDGKWYTTSGIQLPKKPTRSGLYIYNGKVKTIK